MELQYLGANCIKLTTKKAAIVIDDNLAELGQKAITKPDNIVLRTSFGLVTPEGRLTIEQPGEYEVSDISIQGVAARSHLEESTDRQVTIYKIVYDDIRLVVTGHIYPELSESQLESLGTVDVLVIPVGGNGYTLDPIGALKIIRKIMPKLVIPVHYADKQIKYPVPQQELADALKELAMEPKETVDKLKLKPADLATDVTQLVILSRQ